MSINPNQIIIDAIGNSNNWANLSEYFFREFKKSERDEYYSLDAFFDPIIEKLNSLENSLKSQFNSWKQSHEKGLQKALNNEWEPSGGRYGQYMTDCKNGYTGSYEIYKKEYNQRIAENTKLDLEEINLNNFESNRVNLFIPYLNINKINKIQTHIISTKDNLQNNRPNKKDAPEIKQLSIKDIIIPELLDRYDTVFKIFNKTTADKIRKAAFIVLLWDKKYFNKSAVNVNRAGTLPAKPLNKIGMIIFGESFETQLKSKERIRLNAEKNKLKNSLFN